MKCLIVCCFLVFTTSTNAQSFFQYKFAAADSKIELNQKTKEEVIAVFQKKLFKLKYNNAKCFYDSVAKLFVVQTDNSIQNTLLPNDLLRYSKSGFEIYELYSQHEFLRFLSDKDFKNTNIKNLPSFLNMPIADLNKGNPFLNLISFSDTAKFSADVLKYKNQLPTDIIFAQGKLKTPSDKYIEIFGLKNNTNKIITKGLIDTASFGYDDMGYISLNIKFNASGKLKISNFTKQNINKTVAMVINNTVLMAPRVTSEISEGNLQISGNFTLEEATEFVSILTADNLPIRLKFVKSEIVKQ
jgi:hypothetical protein